MTSVHLLLIRGCLLLVMDSVEISPNVLSLNNELLKKLGKYETEAVIEA